MANAAATRACHLFYWRERSREVDFVLRAGNKLALIEVKSGKPRNLPSGMEAFVAAHGAARKVLVGGEGAPVEEFLASPPASWL